jgi:arylsulfatase
MRISILVLALFAWARPAPAGTSDRELIFLILIDAVRADHVGAYGYDRQTTPVIDRLSAKGVRYARVRSNAPWTRPSTASLLTGVNASRHRTETEKTELPEGIRTLAHRLKAAGWTTSGFSANGNGGSLAGLHAGFDIFRDPTNTYTRKKRGKTYNGLPSAEFLTGEVIKHLKKSQAEKEFVFVFYVDPHDPYYAPPRLEKMFLGDFKGKIRRRTLWEKDNDYPADERFSAMAIYDAGIRYADEQLGVLLAGLEKMGLRDKATFFISADHGEGFGEHGFYLHAHHFWEEVIHVPLIAVGPRFPPAVDNRLAQSIDVTATILDLAQADASGVAGHSLLEPATAGGHIISEYNEFGIHRQAIVGERYKVIWQRPADEKWYLSSFSDKFTVAQKKAFFPSVSFGEEVVHVYDLQSDPGEKKDLSANMPAEAAALLTELRAFVGESDRLAKAP